MINEVASELSVVRRCELAGISRSSFYYEPTGESELNLKLMKLIVERHPPSRINATSRFPHLPVNELSN